jgi:protein-disulfide isomerase
MENDIKNDKFFPAYIIGASILIAGILVSATIFYSFRMISSQTTGINTAQDSDKPVNVATRSNAPFIGNKNAKVTLVEFSDFQCPFSKSYFQNTLSQIKKKYVDTGKVKIVFRNLVLPFHQNAQKAAEAGECANKQGKFWEYHDILFTKGQSDGTGLDTTSLKKYAVELSLDTQKFNQCLDNGEAADAVKKDMADAQSAGASGTPTFYINGEQIVGALPFSTFEQTIDKALK